MLSGPSTSATSYRGPPLQPRHLTLTAEPIMVWLRAFNTITSTAGGVISPVYANTDPRTLSIDFSNYASLYSQYRVVSVHFHFQPVLIYSANNVLTFGQPALIGTQRNSVASPAAYTDVATLADCKQFSVNQPYSFMAKSLDANEMNFVGVGSDPATTYSIKIFASGYAATTVYGSTLITYGIQFLSRF